MSADKPISNHYAGVLADIKRMLAFYRQHLDLSADLAFVPQAVAQMHARELNQILPKEREVSS